MSSQFATKFHADGTVTLWSVYTQQWECTDSPSAQVLASLPEHEREKVIEHCCKAEGLSPYRYATDAGQGYIRAKSFDDACDQLSAMLDDTDGGFGWVEDHDGYRYEIEAE